MSITSYTLKIKELCDSLDSISINVEDDEMVQICLGGLQSGKRMARRLQCLKPYDISSRMVRRRVGDGGRQCGSVNNILCLDH